MPFLETGTLRRFAPDKLQKINLVESPQMFCDLYCLEPGQEQKTHTHGGASKFYFVLEGRALFTLGSERRELGPGGLAWAGPGESHGVSNASTSRVVLLVAMAPNPNAQ